MRVIAPPVLIRCIALIVVVTATTAGAAQQMLIQADYFSENFPINQQRLFVEALVDLDSISGIGTERAVVTAMGMNLIINDIGTDFTVARLTDPPDITTPMNLFSQFEDGALDLDLILGTVSAGGGNTFTLLRNPGTNTDAVARFAGSEVVYGPSVISTGRFRLDQDSVTTLIIPEPSGVALFGIGVCGLLTVRRRRA